MDRLTLLKRILKYEILKMPIWCWAAAIIMIFLLRHLIADLIMFIFPVLALITAFFHFTSQPRRAASMGIVLVISILIAVFC